MGSSGATQTADYLRNKLPEVEVVSPDIPLHPEEALRMLNRLCYEIKPDVIIGTSMGAMYAQQMHGYTKILVNPAFHVSEIMRNNMGTNKWLNPRSDGQTEFLIDKKLCELYQQMEKAQFVGITEYDKKHTYAFFGTEDTLVNGYDEYLRYYGNATQYPGEHRLLQKWVKAYILPCITQILDEDIDTENISAAQTNELLLEISDSGKKGRLAYDELVQKYSKFWGNIALNYDGTVTNVMDVARDGFRIIVELFIEDYDDMPILCFPKVLEQRLNEYFRWKGKWCHFTRLAEEGGKLDELYAMRLLTEYYIDNCGISLGERTIAYDCGTIWLDRYNERHPEESRWNKRTPFIKVMPIICEDYQRELYDDYDISYVSPEDQRSIVMSNCTDDDTCRALCWAINAMLDDRILQSC